LKQSSVEIKIRM